MNVVYLCNFDFTRSGGKDRATRQKVEALSKVVTSLKVFNLNKGGSLYKILKGTILDISCSFFILSNKPDVLISRGSTGFFSILTAKLLGILTVREVHALSQNELNLLSYKGMNLFFLKILSIFFHKLDLWVDVRIFNHPFLLEHFREKGWSKSSDFYCYNGYGDDSVANINKSDARIKFNLPEGYKYLVFTGSVSAWHGADYLVDLQKELNRNDDKIKIIVGGGSLKNYDPDSICINITPMNDIECSELIQTADACLLPVKINRISPGSPLKLYDYISNNRPVIAENISGYSDEVLKYNIGISIDFKNSVLARNKIVQYLTHLDEKGFDKLEIPVSWKDRMIFWMSKIEKIL